ncbi:RdgB/HAM1 family non-canonical purine NTP pyrophosphatase [Tissierella creatinophila]|nr:RdgB/HAM1 family non-canonical purine NTP pyrophosphatase [Tissierella creatinophila]
MKEILKDLDIEVLSKEDIGLNNFDVVEDGTTLEENSIKKAKALKEKTPFMVMADDSGLFVESLNGEPGVYSARYAGEEGNDDKNNQKLLQMMKDLPMDKRKASFFSVIALITENGEVLTVKGECKGSIGFELKGHNDFGYDPLFTPEGYEKTFAELSGEVKNKISHRAKALEEIKKTLTNLLEN